MTHSDWMQMAIRMATDNVIAQNRGPFAALVVRHGELIAASVNEVTKSHDPTAHAEIQAIRKACQVLGNFQLTNCDIYTSCEPCPMCFGAIYWARPRAVYYACTAKQAADIGFDDKWIYEEIVRSGEARSIPMTQVYPVDADEPFRMWEETDRKTRY